jgi:two-component system cell cycle sensor histidine kinase/response regulator CckA
MTRVGPGARHLPGQPRVTGRDRDAEDAGRITLVYLLVGIAVLVVTEVVLAAHESPELRIGLRLLFLALTGSALMLLIRRELTGRRRAEEQLEHGERLDAIGRLAGGVAHDFNNLLTVINGFTELALRRLPHEDPSRSDLEAVRRAGAQASELVDQLLTLSRHRIRHAAVVDPNETLRSLRGVLERTLGERAALEISTSSAGRVLIDPSHLGQVLLNLAANARDAMADGGRMTVATHQGRLVDGRRAVVLTVTDTGSGMDAETARRCFEPFFSTRPRGEGAGLGLATVFAIVAQADGEVTVASAPGRGTTFTIRLPQAHGAVIDLREEGAPRPRSARVLLVDDESAVRSFAVAVLSEHGYDVWQAASGAAALALLADEGAPDLLVTDVVMPGMGGVELARRVGELAPDVPVLFISGYVDDPALRERARRGAPVLAKPFLSADLADAVDRALSTSRSPAQGSNR